ncbi:MAG: CDP-diacylglycerol--glycerol-3-phosphate 3-phosphatidyltransferase [Pseudobacteriovorax sp.]|nr:CDP-diacylglycerol--glycerol-3-phosphate 3-phosphatidyltransferase [Pseudobacteriovorax sp.]
MQKVQIASKFQGLPNKLTMMRIIAVPLLLILFPWQFTSLRVICAIIFGLAAITDFFDGYLARKYGAETKLGAVLDPISDKILVTAALILLVGASIVPAWMATALICREMAISGLRLAATEQNFSITVNQLGKWKTGVQDLSIGFLMSTLPSLYGWGMGLLWLALGLSLYSGYRYWQEYWKNVEPTKNNQ